MKKQQEQQFLLTPEQWKSVEEIFEAPPKVLPGLARVITEPDEWDGEKSFPDQPTSATEQMKGSNPVPISESTFSD